MPHSKFYTIRYLILINEKVAFNYNFQCENYCCHINAYTLFGNDKLIYHMDEMPNIENFDCHINHKKYNVKI